MPVGKAQTPGEPCDKGRTADPGFAAAAGFKAGLDDCALGDVGQTRNITISITKSIFMAPPV